MAKDKESDRVLRHPFKATEETKGLTKALARIWRTILFNYNVGPEEYSDLVTKYLRDPRNRISTNPVKRNSERSNLINALFHAAGKMTWKSLCKGFNILCLTRIEIRITTYREDHPTLEHYIDLPIRDSYKTPSPPPPPPEPPAKF